MNKICIHIKFDKNPSTHLGSRHTGYSQVLLQRKLFLEPGNLKTDIINFSTLRVCENVKIRY